MGALWKRQSQNGGTTYLAGNLKGEGVVIFGNKNKGDNPKAPDYIVYKSKDLQKKQDRTEEEVTSADAEEIL